MADPAQPDDEIDFPTFLEAAGIGTEKVVTGLYKGTAFQGSLINQEITSPRIKQYCDSDHCSTVTFWDSFYRYESLIEGLAEQTYAAFAAYACSNCMIKWKSFAFLTTNVEIKHCRATKIAEHPVLLKVPKAVRRLIDNDFRLYQKGQRSEALGHGIGAFSYYRRVVENMKGRLFDRIIQVAKLDAAKHGELIKELEAAKKETQFVKAIDQIKAGIPERLLVGSHNPLTLLHDALSEGLHQHTDEECLEIATELKVIMHALIERLDAALAEEAELQKSVNSVMAKKSRRVQGASVGGDGDGSGE